MIKPTALRVDVSGETGEVMLLIETACGFRPVLGWPNRNEMQNFAETLLGICSGINEQSANKMIKTDIKANNSGIIRDIL